MNLASPHIDRAALISDELTPTRETVTDLLHRCRIYMLGTGREGPGYHALLNDLDIVLGIGSSARNFKEGQTA